MYIQGVSTRRVKKIVGQLCGFSVSASQVSALVKTLDAELEAWRKRSLAGTRYPYLVVDAHYEKVRCEGRVRSTAVLWVVGITEEGYREHLGVWLGGSESRDSWGRVFQDLVQRGLSGVTYVVSDEHAGLCQALKRYFPEAEHQRCQVHYLRNAFSFTNSEELQQVIKSALHDVWEAPSRSEAEGRLARFVATVRSRSARLADWLEETAQETLGFLRLPAAHRKRLRTTNGMEHDHMQVRRRTRVIRIFPNDESLLRLISALAVERNEQWCEKKYVTFEAKEGVKQAA
jgi:putative transposase